MENIKQPKVTGFTLVELLVVIAILAVLTTTTVLVLNPAELIKQARDSSRISDLAALNSAIALYLADYTNATTSSNTYCSATTTSGTAPPATCTDRVASTSVTGTGWVDIDFTQISVGSPLSRLPLDPTNNANYYYGFKTTTGLTFEIIARMESTKYATTTATEVMSTTKDGGDDSGWYEVGNDPGLNLF